MPSIKKYIWVVLFLGTSSVFITACSGGSSGTETPAAENIPLDTPISATPVVGKEFTVQLESIDVRRVSNSAALTIKTVGVSSGTIKLVP